MNSVRAVGLVETAKTVRFGLLGVVSPQDNGSALTSSFFGPLWLFKYLELLVFSSSPFSFVGVGLMFCPMSVPRSLFCCFHPSLSFPLMSASLHQHLSVSIHNVSLSSRLLCLLNSYLCGVFVPVMSSPVLSRLHQCDFTALTSAHGSRRLVRTWIVPAVVCKRDAHAGWWTVRHCVFTDGATAAWLNSTQQTVYSAAEAHTHTHEHSTADERERAVPWSVYCFRDCQRAFRNSVPFILPWRQVLET